MAGSPDKVQVSLRLPNDLYETFGKIATALERDRTWVMLRAFRLYVESEGGDVLRDAEGIASLDRGEGVDFDTTMDEIDEIISRAEKQAAVENGRK